MKFPIQLEQINGHFSASMLGNPALRVDAPSREAALSAMQTEISRRIQLGEIVWLDIPQPGMIDFVGILKDDPTLEELREEIYRQRDSKPYPDYE
jgi:hypothetical protein